jgi:hypothetical protein
MAATLTAIDLDADLLGPVLVAEIEAYLKSLPAPAAKPLLPRLTAPQISRYGRVVQEWDHDVDPGDRITVKRFLSLMDRYIHQYGWTQGLLWDPQGRVCLLGARAKVLAAGYGTPGIDEQARLLIGNQLGYRGEGMPLDNWNDMPGRSVCDIHALLQATATRTR